MQDGGRMDNDSLWDALLAEFRDGYATIEASSIAIVAIPRSDAGIPEFSHVFARIFDHTDTRQIESLHDFRVRGQAVSILQVVNDGRAGPDALHSLRSLFRRGGAVALANLDGASAPGCTPETVWCGCLFEFLWDTGYVGHDESFSWIRSPLAASIEVCRRLRGRDDPDRSDATPTGFLGGEELAEALGVHTTRRDAFFQQLTRKRKTLGGECWKEVGDAPAHSPRFLYRVDSDALRDLAVGYQSPKPA
ncbi:MAG: hypothetical protein DWQ41_13245 [Planctomycetota bacterium]|nr:MAG: hypothetical protein DWQ41_13245 [Planctomycetota bacterium]